MSKRAVGIALIGIAVLTFLAPPFLCWVPMTIGIAYLVWSQDEVHGKRRE
jgi:hypothetical protein